MPPLRELECSIEYGPHRSALREYGTTYKDGFVETYVVVPDNPETFAVHLSSDAYIAPGLAAFAFVDGVAQCKRIQLGLMPAAPGGVDDRSLVDFRLRHKESKICDDRWLARQWSFVPVEIVDDHKADASNERNFESIGTIEVVVLRCQKQRPSALVKENSKAVGQNLIPDKPVAIAVEYPILMGFDGPDERYLGQKYNSIDTERQSKYKLPNRAAQEPQARHRLHHNARGSYHSLDQDSSGLWYWEPHKVPPRASSAPHHGLPKPGLLRLSPSNVYDPHEVGPSPPASDDEGLWETGKYPSEILHPEPSSDRLHYRQLMLAGQLPPVSSPYLPANPLYGAAGAGYTPPAISVQRGIYSPTRGTVFDEDVVDIKIDTGPRTSPQAAWSPKARRANSPLAVTGVTESPRWSSNDRLSGKDKHEAFNSDDLTARLKKAAKDVGKRATKIDKQHQQGSSTPDWTNDNAAASGWGNSNDKTTDWGDSNVPSNNATWGVADNAANWGDTPANNDRTAWGDANNKTDTWGNDNDMNVAWDAADDKPTPWGDATNDKTQLTKDDSWGNNTQSTNNAADTWGDEQPKPTNNTTWGDDTTQQTTSGDAWGDAQATTTTAWDSWGSGDVAGDTAAKSTDWGTNSNTVINSIVTPAWDTTDNSQNTDKESSKGKSKGSQSRSKSQTKPTSSQSELKKPPAGPLVKGKPYLKSYFNIDSQTGLIADPQTSQSTNILPPEKLPPVPKSVVAKTGATHQVQGGPAFLYNHYVGRPEYIDSMSKPYAVFCFKYRSRTKLGELFPDLEKEGKIKKETGDWKRRMLALEKEQLLEQLRKAKSAAGYNTDSTLESSSSEDEVIAKPPTPPKKKASTTSHTRSKATKVETPVAAAW